MKYQLNGRRADEIFQPVFIAPLSTKALLIPCNNYYSFIKITNQISYFTRLRVLKSIKYSVQLFSPHNSVWSLQRRQLFKKFTFSYSFLMQGFSKSIKNRYKRKCPRKRTQVGSGNLRNKRKINADPAESLKKSKKRSKRRRE